jgi:small-conductance mechanosensitive channel
MPLDPEFWTETFREIAAGVLAWLPTIVGALLWLILGWIVARIARLVFGNLLQRLRIDRLGERSGVSQLLSDAGMTTSTSRVIAQLIYWLILLVFFVAAADSLGLQGVVDTLTTLIAFLPNVVAAILIFLIGSLIARMVGEAVGAVASRSELDVGPVVGQGVRYILLILVVILAIGQLGIETTVLITVTVVLVVALGLGLALAFGVGSRNIAQNIMAGLHARDSFIEGQQLEVRGHTGRLVTIGPVKTVIETENGLVTLPNAALTDEEVTVLIEAPGPDQAETGEPDA